MMKVELHSQTKEKKVPTWQLQCVSQDRLAVVQGTYLGKLPPIQEVTGIIFENEDKVNFRVMPHSASKREEQNKKIGEEVTSVNLPWSAL